MSEYADDVRRAALRLPDLRREYIGRIDWTIDQLERRGVQAAMRPDLRIVIPAAGLELLRELATVPLPPSPLPASASYVFGIPLVVAPDWTFNPEAVALARVAAIARRPFHRMARAAARAFNP